MQVADPFKATWLGSLSNDALEEVRALSESVSFSDQDVIYGFGQKQEYIWGIASGQVRVLVGSNEMEPALAHVHGPGTWFGSAELFLNSPGVVEHNVAGRAELVRVPYAGFRRLSKRRPEVLVALGALCALTLLLSMSAANDLLLRTGRMRLAATLLRLCGRRGIHQSNVEMDKVPASQAEISALANLSPSTASLLLKDFEARNMIELKYALTLIKNPEALAAEAEGVMPAA